MRKYEITEEQVRELASGRVGVHFLLRSWFPDEFKNIETSEAELINLINLQEQERVSLPEAAITKAEGRG
jgi:hypothetical protein